MADANGTLCDDCTGSGWCLACCTDSGARAEGVTEDDAEHCVVCGGSSTCRTCGGDGLAADHHIHSFEVRAGADHG